MKKILFVLMALTFSYGAMAQKVEKKMDTGMHHMKSMKHPKDCVIMKDGKMMVMKEGKTMEMTEDMTMENGTMVMKDGNVKMKNGKTMMLKEGDCIDMKGNLMKMKKKMPMKEHKM